MKVLPDCPDLCFSLTLRIYEDSDIFGIGKIICISIQNSFVAGTTGMRLIFPLPHICWQEKPDHNKMQHHENILLHLYQ